MAFEETCKVGLTHNVVSVAMITFVTLAAFIMVTIVPCLPSLKRFVTRYLHHLYEKCIQG